MTIPEIVKEYVLKNCKRMPETKEEVDEYLDLINHAKEYEKALYIKATGLSKKMIKKLGFKTPEEVKAEGSRLFKK